MDPRHGTVIGIITMGEKTLMMVDVERIVAELEPSLALEGNNIERRTLDRTYRIVMAEDSEIIRRMLQDKLTAAGFNVAINHDGLEAWEMLEGLVAQAGAHGAISDHVDLIISDIEMPRMDGYTLIRKIKEHPRLSGVPVVLFSSMISDDNYHKGVSVGADAQLTKPMLGELVDTIHGLIQGRRQAA